jgi:flagellar protein FlgJ
MSSELPKLTGNLAADAAAGMRNQRLLPLKRPGLDPIEIGKRAAGRLTGKPSEHTELSQLRKAAEDFEAVFLALTLKQMRSTIQKDELFNGGMGEDVFTEMLDEELAKKTASTGHTGIAELLFQQLSRQYASARGADTAQGADNRMPDASQAAGALMRRLRETSPDAAAGLAAPALPDL